MARIIGNWQNNSITTTTATNGVTGGFSTAFDDHIEGAEGNDTIRAGAGADLVYGGLNNDSIYGDDGNDTSKR